MKRTFGQLLDQLDRNTNNVTDCANGINEYYSLISATRFEGIVYIYELIFNGATPEPEWGEIRAEGKRKIARMDGKFNWSVADDATSW
jgi:hypothetical protein